MKEKLMKFMMGRYGADQLNRFLLVFAVILVMLAVVFRLPLLNTLGLAALIYSYFRMFSRNVQRRYQENVKYLALKNRFLGFFKNKIWYLKQMRTYHIYKCPGCGQKIRIPRGKGRIQVSCPKCRNTFIKNS